MRFWMKTLKKILLSIPIVNTILLTIRYYYLGLKVYVKTREKLNNVNENKKSIFYLGVPAHNNLGDLAQGVCIRRWIKKHYPECQVVEIETNAIVNTPFSLLRKLVELYKPGDMIIYQSGYTTTDLGGFADEMHRVVMQALPDATMLMLPQTIFFKNVENKKRTSICYNSMRHMLFLARDRISFEMAREMFPDIVVKQFPDIVTTLIGKYRFDYERKGILFCCRDDSEKYYSKEEIAELISKCESICEVKRTDTTKDGKKSRIVENAEMYIEKEIDTYAQYKLIITDRYHGTILSLVAGTPVIVLKTTDHKVTTGAEWFRGIYDDYVYVAENLEQAYNLAQHLLLKELTHILLPYFEENYYNKLPSIFKKYVEE